VGTRFTELVGCPLPIQQAGFGAVATPALAAAVAQAGGLGMLGMHADPLADRLDAIGATSPIGVNFLVPFLSDLGELELAATSARVVELFFGDPDAGLVRRIHDGGALAAWQAGSRDEAQAAEDAGCDFVVAQGVEAGGHVRGTRRRRELVPSVRAAVDIPVVAAGGIATADDVAAALHEGADAVRVGTRFVASEQTGAHPDYVDALLAAHGRDATVLTTAYRIGWDAPHRVLRSAIAAAEHTEDEPVAEIGPVEDPVAIPRWSTLPPTRDTRGHISAMALYAGTAVGSVDRVQDAAAIVRELAEGVDRAERRSRGRSTSSPGARDPAP
jgi:nitronate monooxygenase